ncbi:phosphate ABC transporter substrate-binding protein [Weissella oryzae SG25]|uniref:Phosphate-binding protein n=1 Tax=Weissella oryzae (strain DSM 25784 / JCM 18191 / LMG 30913 / SG25) TaxID=1329250 RepID=A0A069CYE3_WEIOS|nr:phosphate ABC transporter substrate-binding protein [Weissella oryzae SG25]
MLGKQALASGILMTTIIGTTFTLVAPAVNASTEVLAVGSTALQPLAEQAGTSFQATKTGVTVNVQGGGSGAGLSQVGSGGVTIGNSDIFAEQKAGVDSSKLKDNKVAVVGIAPVVNRDVKVNNLKASQLQAIFTGKITNWKQVGGQNQKIVLITRADGSGTRVTFDQAVMQGKNEAQAQSQDQNGAVQKIVAQTPGAISYLAFSYTKGSAAAGLKSLSIDKVKPNTANVTTNKWKIWAYEHMYTTSQPDKNTAAFIKYMKSPAVQKKLLGKLGYIQISQMHVEKDSSGKVTKLK